MAVLIKDAEVDRLVRQLARRTGESITEAVRKAAAERIARLPLSPSQIAERRRRMRTLLVKLDAMPTVDHRTPDEIVGTNDRGHFD